MDAMQNFVPTVESISTLPSSVSAARARRKANGYLCLEVGLFFGATDPVYVETEPLLWQVTIELTMPRARPVTLGTLDVNAETGDIVPLSPEQIESLQERARAIVKRTALPAEA